MTDTTTLAPTDAEIEELLKSCGMSWVERSFWQLEDADLHPAIRAILAKWGAPAPASDALRTAAQAIVARWDTPHWKDAEHTGAFIQRLREALAAPPAQEARILLTGEQQRCIAEAHSVAACEEYFAARPQIDFTANRRIFEAGFSKGYGITAAQKETP